MVGRVFVVASGVTVVGVTVVVEACLLPRRRDSYRPSCCPPRRPAPLVHEVFDAQAHSGYLMGGGWGLGGTGGRLRREETQQQETS